jgi:hypothetical protein
VENGFGIGTGTETMSNLDKALLELGKIIDFAVKNNPCAAILIRHGLVATRKVNDTQPTTGKSDVATAKESVIIRPTMCRNIAHVFQESRLDRSFALKIEEPVNATHTNVWSPLASAAVAF